MGGVRTLFLVMAERNPHDDSAGKHKGPAKPKEHQGGHGAAVVPVYKWDTALKMDELLRLPRIWDAGDVGSPRDHVNLELSVRPS